MTTIFGLPAHALLVHAAVVLVPLTAALEILCALWPAARRRLVWLVLAFAVGVMVLIPLTVSAGEWLYDQAPQHAPILETHQERAAWAIYFAIGLLVVGRRAGASALDGVEVGSTQARARRGGGRARDRGRGVVRGRDRAHRRLGGASRLGRAAVAAAV